ncbi:MAG TPA: c-type cytochrome biogenesis protein CcmI [Acetobacteraceae bacterium]|jgi:cytochrome c-type biogenesis protein CcmH
MVFIIVFSAVALAATLALCLPLLTGVSTLPERGQFDRAVYRDQLKELERDVARGVLSGGEAETTRLEIQRRLLAADSGPSARAMRFGRSPGLAAVVGVLMLCGAVALYLQIGAPFLPDAPFASRAKQEAPSADAGPEHLDMRAAAVRLEQKLKQDPNNAEGWVLYARTESMLGDWEKAGDAYHHAIDLGDTTPNVYAGLGEMLVLSMGGIVAPAAHGAFEKTLAADPKNEVARYYLALADAQAGEEKRAIDAWVSLAADLPDDSPMREQIANGIQQAAKAGGVTAPPIPKGVAEPPPAVAAPGAPTQDQMAAAAQMTPAQRTEMIRGMVAQLAVKLQAQPDDLDGWMRLGRAYAVLGDLNKAGDAYEHAVKLKPGDLDIRLQAVGMLLGGLKPSDPLPLAAVSMLQEVQAISPDQPEALWYLGIVAARQGHPDVARADWTKLLAKMPPNGDDAKLVKDALAALK